MKSIYNIAHKAGWNYSGDINIEYGGFFWKEDGADDYVLAIKVIPVSDAGGPGNKWCIEQGSVYMPTDRPAPFDILGIDPSDVTRADCVEAWHAYAGIERGTWNGETYVQIGKSEETDREGWNPDPDVTLRGNASLARYVEGLL